MKAKSRKVAKPVRRAADRAKKPTARTPEPAAPASEDVQEMHRRIESEAGGIAPQK